MLPLCRTVGLESCLGFMFGLGQLFLWSQTVLDSLVFKLMLGHWSQQIFSRFWCPTAFKKTMFSQVTFLWEVIKHSLPGWQNKKCKNYLKWPQKSTTSLSEFVQRMDIHLIISKSFQNGHWHWPPGNQQYSCENCTKRAQGFSTFLLELKKLFHVFSGVTPPDFVNGTGLIMIQSTFFSVLVKEFLTLPCIMVVTWGIVYLFICLPILFIIYDSTSCFLFLKKHVRAKSFFIGFARWNLRKIIYFAAWL